MNWNKEQDFRMTWKCPFEGTEDFTTISAATEKDAVIDWKMRYDYAQNVVATPLPRIMWTPADNPDFGDYRPGYKLVDVTRHKWMFTKGERQYVVQTWMRDSMQMVWHPNRDISEHELVLLVPVEMLTHVSADDIAHEMYETLESWNRSAAERGQLFVKHISPTTCKITISWTLDLS